MIRKAIYSNSGRHVEVRGLQDLPSTLQVVGTTRTYPNIDCAPATRSMSGSGRIVLQKSKIERDQKFRESRFFDVSTAAKPRSADTMVRGRFLCERMWSLASPLARRISGPRKFCSSPKKDFFNTIGRKAGVRQTKMSS